MEFMNLHWSQWALSVFSVCLIGLAKTGIAGVAILSVPIMAGIFGGKLSTGMMLPLLCVGDAIAVFSYRRHINWFYIKRLLPWTLAGLVLGLTVGELVNDLWFKRFIAASVLAALAVMLWRQRRKDLEIPSAWWFGALFGLAGGFATMIGNAAGPLMTVYMLSMRLPKYEFISTSAWFFFIVNLIKLPIHIFIWKTITIQSLFFDALLLPAVLLGAIAGILTIKLIPERPFQRLVMILTALGAVKLLF